jgi:cell division protein FtsQ
MRRLTPRRLSWFGWFWGRVLQFVKIAAVIAAVAALGLWITAQGYMVEAGRWAEHKLVDATGAMGLRVADVIVEGRNRIDAERLKETIAVEPGDPLLGVDLDDLRARLTGIAWVKDVRVRRAWPDRLIVSLDERQPVALWRDAPGGPAVIDADGVVVARSDLARFGTLLAVEGPDAAQEAGALIALLKAQPDIAVRVQKAVRVSERRWDLVLAEGTVLRLPENDPGYALARVAKAQGQEKILDQGLKAIDLRQSDRIILEGKPGMNRDFLLKGGDAV